MNEVLKRHRAAAAAHAEGKTPDRVLDKQDRHDLTMSPDAKKAREVVRMAATDPVTGHNLPALALAISKVTGEQKAKHLLQEAYEEFCEANALYFQEEGKPGSKDQLIGWMGGFNGFGISLPAEAPYHKIHIRDAWDKLLQRVNDATKVGVQKLHKERPITLMADLESTRLILPADYDPLVW